MVIVPAPVAVSTDIAVPALVATGLAYAVQISLVVPHPLPPIGVRHEDAISRKLSGG